MASSETPGSGGRTVVTPRSNTGRESTVQSQTIDLEMSSVWQHRFTTEVDGLTGLVLGVIPSSVTATVSWDSPINLVSNTVHSTLPKIVLSLEPIKALHAIQI